MAAALLAMLVALSAAPAAPSPSPGPSSQENPTISIPRGTVIPVTVTKAVRVGGLGGNTEAQKVRFRVTQDVIVNGYVIAKAGDLAEGSYTNQTNVTHRVFSTNVSQEVTLDIDDIVNFCGDTIHIGFERTFVGGARGGFMSFGIHAHDAVFDKGVVLKAATDRREREICAEPTTASPAPLPSGMVLPDDEATGQ